MSSAHAWAGGPHPWREWQRYPHVNLWWRRLPVGVHALTDGVRNVWHNVDELQVERRFSTRHEQEHMLAGHDGCVGGVDEDRIHHRAAKWLTPDPRKVAEALVLYGDDVAMAADHLWLPERGLVARLDVRFMHPAERSLIARAVASEQHTA